MNLSSRNLILTLKKYIKIDKLDLVCIQDLPEFDVDLKEGPGGVYENIAYCFEVMDYYVRRVVVFRVKVNDIWTFRVHRQAWTTTIVDSAGSLRKLISYFVGFGGHDSLGLTFISPSGSEMICIDYIPAAGEDSQPRYHLVNVKNYDEEMVDELEFFKYRNSHSLNSLKTTHEGLQTKNFIRGLEASIEDDRLAISMLENAIVVAQSQIDMQGQIDDMKIQLREKHASLDESENQLLSL